MGNRRGTVLTTPGSREAPLTRENGRVLGPFVSCVHGNALRSTDAMPIIRLSFLCSTQKRLVR